MGWFRECTAGFAKYILFVFNLIILVAAIILIVFAVKLKTENGGLDYNSVGTFSIVVGVLIALIAFFGCCGAVKEDSCMLTTYAAICITLFIIQLVLGVLAFVAVQKGDEKLHDEVKKYLDNIYVNRTKDNDEYEVINAIQKNLECCGRSGQDDPEVRNGSGPGLIASCCDASPCTTATAYKANCYDKMTDWLDASIKAIGAVAIVFCVVELLAGVFACYVKHTRN